MQRWGRGSFRICHFGFHYTSKQRIFNLCSVFAYAYFGKTVVSCFYSFHKCLERRESRKRFVLCNFEHIHVNYVYTFCHVGTKYSTNNFAHPQGLCAFGQNRRDKWRCITRLSSCDTGVLLIGSSPCLTHPVCLS